MASNEVTVGWEELANVIIKSLSDAALEPVRDGIKEGGKEVVKEAFADLAKNAAGGVVQGVSVGGLAPVAIAMILGQLLVVQQQQTTLLKSIQRDVKALVEGPYYAGLTHLEDARNMQRTHEERLSFITKARDKFVEAHGNQQNLDRFSRAIIEYEIGICWLLCGSLTDTIKWFERSLTSARQALIDEEASYKNKQRMAAGTKVAGAVGVGIAALLTGGIALASIGAGVALLYYANKLDTRSFIEMEVLERKGSERFEVIYSFIGSLSRILRHINSDTYHTKHEAPHQARQDLRAARILGDSEPSYSSKTVDTTAFSPVTATFTQGLDEREEIWCCSLGHANTKYSAFCDECGEPLDQGKRGKFSSKLIDRADRGDTVLPSSQHLLRLPCPSCSTSNPTNEQFCHKCGLTFLI